MKVRGWEEAFPKPLVTILKKERTHTFFAPVSLALLDCFDASFGPWADFWVSGGLCPLLCKNHRLNWQSLLPLTCYPAPTAPKAGAALVPFVKRGCVSVFLLRSLSVPSPVTTPKSQAGKLQMHRKTWASLKFRLGRELLCPCPVASKLPSHLLGITLAPEDVVTELPVFL